MGFDRAIAGCEALLIHVEEFEILGEHEDMLGPIVPRERGHNLVLRRMTPIVAMLREPARIALAGHDVAQDAQAGHAGDVADDERQLHVHLDERFLHALDVRARALDERRPMPEIRAERDDVIGRSKAAADTPRLLFP